MCDIRLALVCCSYRLILRIRLLMFFFFFSSRRRHTRFDCDWSSDVCSSDLCTSCYLKTSAILSRREVTAGTASIALGTEGSLYAESSVHGFVAIIIAVTYGYRYRHTAWSLSGC